MANGQLRDGSYWLRRTGEALPTVARFMALNRYGGVPDRDDRVADALVAVAVAIEGFRPASKQDTLGYFLQYAFSQVAGTLRNGAQSTKDEADGEVVFTDLDPEWLGVDYLFERGDAPDVAQDNLWVTKWGFTSSTTELIDLLMGDQRWVDYTARKLQVAEPGSAEHRLTLLQAFDALATDESTEPTWMLERAEHEPVARDLEPVVVKRRSRGWSTGMLGLVAPAMAEVLEWANVKPTQVTDAVNEASRGGAVWTETQEPAPYEMWRRDWEEEKLRPVGALAADERSWPSEVTHDLWADVKAAVIEGYVAGFDVTVNEVLYSVEHRPNDVFAVLADRLLEVDDGQAETVVRALGRLIKAEGDDLDRLMIGFGLDETGSWYVEDESAESLQGRIEAWLERVFDRGRSVDRGEADHMWDTQIAAVTALVLEGASPWEAKQVSRRVYAQSRA